MWSEFPSSFFNTHTHTRETIFLPYGIAWTLCACVSIRAQTFGTPSSAPAAALQPPRLSLRVVSTPASFLRIPLQIL